MSILLHCEHIHAPILFIHFLYRNTPIIYEKPAKNSCERQAIGGRGMVSSGRCLAEIVNILHEDHIQKSVAEYIIALSNTVTAFQDAEGNGQCKAG